MRKEIIYVSIVVLTFGFGVAFFAEAFDVVQSYLTNELGKLESKAFKEKEKQYMNKS